QHFGLPRCLLLAPGAVAPGGRRADHPERVVLRTPGTGGLMRRAGFALLVLVAVAALGMPAGAASRKHEKRAKVHRSPARASAERLVDAAGPIVPPGDPQDPPRTVPPLPSFVSVAAREFSLTLSRPLVGAGSVRV